MTAFTGLTHGTRVALAAAAVVLIGATTACSSGAGAGLGGESSPSAHDRFTVAAQGLDGVADVSTSPFGDDTAPDDTANVSVIVSADAGDADILSIADAIPDIVGSTGWPGSVDLQRDGPSFDAEADSSISPPWTVRAYPRDGSDIGARLADVLALERIDGVRSICFGGGWAFIGVDAVDRFTAVGREASRLRTFDAGATYSIGGDDPLLRIVDVPKRITDDFFDAVVAIAADHPAAEVLLEAPTTGEQWPRLYIARISAEEEAAIDVRLRDPALARSDPDGYPIPFILTASGADGDVYVEGNVGDVPG